MENSIRNEYSKMGKRFRQRFRVPYSIFEEICSSLIEEGYYQAGRCANGWPKVEIELLVLASLRLLGSGCSFDLVEECTNVHAHTICKFFQQKFCKWGRALAKRLIKLPESKEELWHVVGLYERIGLPGCVGSVDCVHLVWDKCPAGYLSQCKGKERHATLAFQAVVSHTKKILSLSQFFGGATNDKSIARYDSTIRQIRGKSKLLADMEWGAYSRDGEVRKQKGAYFICDGGYHFWEQLIAPYKMQIAGSRMERWSSNLESAQKDVECTFGILKKQFLFLKNPIEIQAPEKIEDAFMTCAALHNWLHDYDGYDDWEGRAGVVTEEDITVEYDPCYQSNCTYSPWLTYFGFDGNFTRAHASRLDPNAFHDDNNSDELASEREKYEERRLLLIEHYTLMENNRTLYCTLLCFIFVSI